MILYITTTKKNSANRKKRLVCAITLRDYLESYIYDRRMEKGSVLIFLKLCPVSEQQIFLHAMLFRLRRFKVYKIFCSYILHCVSRGILSKLHVLV